VIVSAGSHDRSNARLARPVDNAVRRRDTRGSLCYGAQLLVVAAQFVSPLARAFRRSSAASAAGLRLQVRADWTSVQPSD